MKFRLRPLYLLSFSLVVLLTVEEVSFAGEWPRFRGPKGNGHAEVSDVPTNWSEDQVLWKVELPGPGASSPVVTGDKVFLTSYSGYGLVPDQGEPESLQRHALCFDLESGELLWDHPVESENRVTPYTGRYITMHGYASSSPVTDGKRVYFFLEESGVFAFTLDGQLGWKADVGSGTHDWGSGPSPILHENLLIVNAAAESDRLVALDKVTGKEVWSVSGMPRSWNTPLVVEPEEGKPELVVSLQGKIRGFDPTTGEELWFCQGIRAAELCPSPVYGDGVLFILGHPRGEAMAVRAGGRGDVTDSHVLWRLPKGSNVGSPIYHEGHLYWASDNSGIFYCVEGKTGEILYEERAEPRASKFYASPVLVSDRLYYVSRESGTYVVAAHPTFELLAHDNLSDAGSDRGDFNGSPAVVDGKVLLRSDRYLYCIGRRE